MRVLLYVRREQGLEQLEAEAAQLADLAARQGHTVCGVILELDPGQWLQRPGLYELARQLQTGCADAVLLSHWSALGSSQSVQQGACALLADYPILLAELDFLEGI